MLSGYEVAPSPARTRASGQKFEQAQGGTLLLDEITEMPLGLQAKLLRVLRSAKSSASAGAHPLHADVRVLATTNRACREEVAAAAREDLYYRLNVSPPDSAIAGRA